MTHRTRMFKDFEIASATTVEAYVCPDPDCKHLHLVGFDEENEPLCEIVVTREYLHNILTKGLQ